MTKPISSTSIGPMFSLQNLVRAVFFFIHKTFDYKIAAAGIIRSGEPIFHVYKKIKHFLQLQSVLGT